MWDKWVQFMQWLDNLPGMQYLDKAVEATGMNPGWLGYLLALPIILALTRRNK